jgi:hypothetical protein
MKAAEIAKETGFPAPVSRSVAPRVSEEHPAQDRSPGALGTREIGISQATARRNGLQNVPARIRDCEPVQKVLDVAKRRLRLDGVELGGRLSESSWAFLEFLADLRPRDFTKATRNDGWLDGRHRIGNTIAARNARRELQRQLPPGVPVKLFMQTAKGRGYRLQADVRIRGKGEAGLQFYDAPKLAVLDKRQAEENTGGESTE